MALILEQGFDIPEENIGDFQEWLRKNETRLREASPEGISYVGSYAVILSTEKTAGGFRLIWELENYAAQDRLSEAIGQPGPFQELMGALHSVVDKRPDAHTSTSLYRALSETSVLGAVMGKKAS